MKKENRKLFEENIDLRNKIDIYKHEIDLKNREIEDLKKANELNNKQYTVIINDCRIELENQFNTEKQEMEKKFNNEKLELEKTINYYKQ